MQSGEISHGTRALQIKVNDDVKRIKIFPANTLTTSDLRDMKSDDESFYEERQTHLIFT